MITNFINMLFNKVYFSIFYPYSFIFEFELLAYYIAGLYSYLI